MDRGLQEIGKGFRNGVLKLKGSPGAAMAKAAAAGGSGGRGEGAAGAEARGRVVMMCSGTVLISCIAETLTISTPGAHDEGSVVACHMACLSKRTLWLLRVKMVNRQA